MLSTETTLIINVPDEETMNQQDFDNYETALILLKEVPEDTPLIVVSNGHAPNMYITTVGDYLYPQPIKYETEIGPDMPF